MLFHVYALCEPDTGEVRYVGCSRDPDKRLGGHLSSVNDRCGNGHALRSWISSLLNRGVKPTMRILDSLEGADARKIGIKDQTLYARKKAGWSDERALNPKVRGRSDAHSERV